MKHYLALPILLLSVFASNAQRVPLKQVKNKIYDVALSYQFLSPTGNGADMGSMDGISAFAGARFLNNRLLIGLEGGISNQPTVSLQKQWPMANQMAFAQVNQYTQIYNWGAFFRYHFRADKIIRYYVTGGMGEFISKSELFVLDPNFEDNCEVIDRRSLMNSKAIYGSIGAGLSISSYFVKADDFDDDLLSMGIDFSCRYFVSAPINLLNVQDTHHGNHGRHTPYSIQFKDLITNTTHSHDIGHIISGPFNGFQFNITLTFSGILSKLKLKPKN